MFIHLTARAEPGRYPFADFDRASWMWPVLRSNWPDALGACLMPDHSHLLTPTDDPEREKSRWVHVLSASSRKWHTAPTWSGIPDPTIIPDRKHLARQIRYVHLNPCRARFASDPLGYHWSTHRGVIGAEIDPWVSAARLARVLGEPIEQFASRFHRYVSSDPSVNPAGSMFPSAAPRRAIAAIPLADVLDAAAAASRWSTKTARDRLTVALALQQGWCDSRALAEALGVTDRTIRRHALHEPAARDLFCAALCLGDVRLRQRCAPAPTELERSTIAVYAAE